MTLTELAMIWGPIKFDFEKAFGLSPDALHIHAGMLLLLLFALIMRRPLHDWRPWTALCFVELANEIVNLNQAGGSIEANFAASAHDLVNTMAIPTLLLIYYRWRRKRQRASYPARFDRVSDMIAAPKEESLAQEFPRFRFSNGAALSSKHEPAEMTAPHP